LGKIHKFGLLSGWGLFLIHKYILKNSDKKTSMLKHTFKRESSAEMASYEGHKIKTLRYYGRNK
jgi:hypothetical protein